MSEELQKESLDEIEIPKKILDEIERVSKERKLNESQKKKLIDAVKNEYLNSCFEPGEAIGIISAQSISEPATQMSCDRDERIILKVDDVIKIIKIGDFFDEMMRKFGLKKENGYEVCDLPQDVRIFVPSLDQDEKVKWKRVNSCLRHKSPKRLIEIKTKSGRKIKATDSHSFVIRKNNRIIPIKGKYLRVGNRIPIINSFPIGSVYSVNIPEMIPSSNLVEKNGLIFTPRSSRGIPREIQLDENFGWFVGAYLSEGSCLNSQVRITNIDENFLSQTLKFLNSMGLRIKVREYHGMFGPSKDLEINSSIFCKFMSDICGKGSYKKKVPEFAFSAPENFISGLLRGYFDGDGSVSVSRKMIRVHSNSEELIDGIKLLLTRFGIFSFKHKEKKQFYLLIPYKYAPVFLYRIGSNIEKKRKSLEALAELAERFWKFRSQDFNDMIEGFDDILYRIAKKLKYPTRFINNFTKRQRIGRTTLHRYIKLFERIAKEKNVNIEKELKVLKRMFNSDVVWDKIVEISYVKPSSEYVYDISVDGLETFTTFDGVITHNTMRTFHFAGSAGIQVTLGLPRLIEIFSAKKELSTPMMTLYLKKKYNTQKYAENIAEEIKEKRLKDFAEAISLDITNRRIRIKLKKLKKRKKDIIVSTIRKRFKNYKISIRENTITIESKEKKFEVKDLQRIKKKMLEICISGIPKVENTIVEKDENDWIIKTLGSNFSMIQNFEEIDLTRSYTNNANEMKDVLGVEAARNTLIKEIRNTMQQQGLDVDERHIMLVADIMTFSGDVRPVGRYGVAGMKPSILTRAGFEETIKHLVKASVRHEEDDFKGIFDNVMVNQQVPVGTGMFELIAKMSEE